MTATVSPTRLPSAHTSWPRDFVLGVRLAVGGGRTSWMRLILGTVGIGLAVTVLFVAASVGTITSNRDARSLSAEASDTVTSVHPLQEVQDDSLFQGQSINGYYVHATGPDSPVPPGLSRIPGPNQIVLSAALAQLIDANPAVRARFPQQVVGTITEPGLRGPADLEFYAGTGPLPTSGGDAVDVRQVYVFGEPARQHSFDPSLLIVAIIGAVALLIPILIFVSVSSRIAGAERDRRLAALRLVGAGSWQVRRIAAAESLVSAGTGIVLGTLVFLGLRALAPDFDLLGWSTFTDDVTPPWPLVVIIVLFIPVLTVGTVLLSMRRTIIEPLGVVRSGKPVRRRLWWRLALVVVGIAALLYGKSGSATASLSWVVMIAAGASALLIGVPVLLPWLLERLVGRIRGGAPSWQLAVRRLQLDSGTPARVVGGVAVVLAGAITLQLVLFAAANRFNEPAVPGAQNSSTGWMEVLSSASAGPKVAAMLAHVPQAKEVDTVQTLEAVQVGRTGPNDYGYEISVASCQLIGQLVKVNGCADGDSFVIQDPQNPITAGMRWEIQASHQVVQANSTPSIIADYTVPAGLRPLPAVEGTGFGPYLGNGIVLTPAAAAASGLPADRYTQTYVRTDPNDLGAADAVTAAISSLTWQIEVESLSSADALTTDQQEFLTIRNILLGGALFTLLLAGVSMLVLALEQVRERRRPLAVLAATGVPRSALARSLLWQTAIPVAVAVAVAVGTGIGLAALVMRLASSLTLVVDWGSIGIFSAAALLLVLLVTALTLPALRSAMRLSALRTE